MNEKELLAQVQNFFTDGWENITDFFASYQWQEMVFAAKSILIVISFLLALLMFLLLVKIIVISPIKKSLYKTSKTRYASPVFNKQKIKKNWGKVEKRVKSGVEVNYKLAILEANKLFDRVVKELGYGVEKKLPNADDIKAAGKFKDKLIEEKKLKVSKEEAEKITETYKKGLEELGML